MRTDRLFCLARELRRNPATTLGAAALAARLGGDPTTLLLLGTVSGGAGRACRTVGAFAPRPERSEVGSLSHSRTEPCEHVFGPGGVAQPPTTGVHGGHG